MIPNWYTEKIKSHPAFSSKRRVVDLDMLYPPFAVAILTLFARARRRGYFVWIYETYRSNERQLELWEQGSTRLKQNSMHHFGIAADIVFLDEGNDPNWDAGRNWKAVGALGMMLGLEWGGSWTDFLDQPHFQFIPATPEDQAKIIAGEYPPYDPALDERAAQLAAFYRDTQASVVLNSALVGLSASCGLLPRDLKTGARGPDVKLAQKILNRDPDTQVAITGAGSPGHETDFFGELSRKAVQQLQKKYNIVLPNSPTYGMADAATREKLEELFAEPKVSAKA